MTLTAIRGLVLWLLMGAAAAYALMAVVEEELALHFGSSRVLLATAQVILDHASCVCSS